LGLVVFCRTEKGYPLIIEATQIQQADVSSPMNRPMLLKLLPKINYDALVQACRQVASQIRPDDGSDESNVSIPDLPDTLPASLLEKSSSNSNNDDDSTSAINDALLVSLHKVLFDIYIVEGFLICPDTGRRFPIKNSIPNMILHEDEI
jgi:multifunctional methyltransferase subunit TRM112